MEFVRNSLDRGVPVGTGETLSMLAAGKSTLVLPIIERKIEEVLMSKSPSACFSAPDVDPARFIDGAALTISYAGNSEALRQMARLMAIDEERFGEYVGRILLRSWNNGNPFKVAYEGLEIGNDALSRRIVAWIASELPGKVEYDKLRLRNWWARAMIGHYGDRLPTEGDWAEDPIASRLPAALTMSMHDVMFKTMIEIMQKRSSQKE